MTRTSWAATRCGSWSCSSYGRHRGCGSCWPPGMTCGWGCTGCGWKASWPRSASRICGSPWPRRPSCSRRPGSSCRRPRGRCCTSGPRGGQRGWGWGGGGRAGHPDPGRSAAGFTGTERTVAEYLLAEVLDRQTEQVRRLLLRTSILERVNGELADLLTRGQGGERVLQDLEAANAFVVSLDTSRAWFRYHQMFAGLLRLELRRAAPGEITALPRAAAGWLAGHGSPVEAIRHAQAAQDWGLAARVLADNWPGLYLDGQAAVIHELLGGFPAGASAADAELAAVAAGDEAARGALEAAERYLGLAERGLASVPEGRRGEAQLLLGGGRVLLARPTRERS